MIFDLNDGAARSTGRRYDVCIAGAGVAGITLAIDLAARGVNVVLLEAGGLEYSQSSQDVYVGKNVGLPYFELDEARLRYLGGTSNHWAGWCRPLDAWDFDRHAHIGYSGWPITKAALDPYLGRASEILEIPTDYNDQPVTGSENAFDRIDLALSTPVNFADKYLADLETSTRIDLFLNANAVDVVLTASGNRIHELKCVNYTDNARRYGFSADDYILTMGGIENARMLLNFQRQTNGALGAEKARDLVGRYFMEHIFTNGGYYAAERDAWPYGDEIVRMMPTPGFKAQKEIANVRLRIGPIRVPGPDLYSKAKQRIICAEDIVRDFIANFYDMWCPTHVFIGGYLKLVSEQVPNPDSRVLLSDDKDKFGLNRTRLDWRVTDLDRHTIIETVLAFGRYLAVQKYGNLKLHEWLLDRADPELDGGDGEWQYGGERHHMGTTRMAQSPSSGVVDANCRMFGVDNLYVAGSSVFPTGGHANPTLTIVQLALRLADHLKGLHKV